MRFTERIIYGVVRPEDAASFLEKCTQERAGSTDNIRDCWLSRPRIFVLSLCSALAKALTWLYGAGYRHERPMTAKVIKHKIDTGLPAIIGF